MIEVFKDKKKTISYKNHKNKIKQVENLKDETNRSLKVIQENTIKPVNEISKIVNDLKLEIETVKKRKTEGTFDMENIGK